MEYKYELFNYIFDSNILERIGNFKNISTLLMNMSNYGIEGHTFRDLTGADLIDKFLSPFVDKGYAIQKKGNKYDLNYLWADGDRGDDYHTREIKRNKMESKTSAFFTFLKALNIIDFIYITPIPKREAIPQAINCGEVGSVSRVKDIPEKIEWFKTIGWMKEHVDMKNLKFFRINKNSSNIKIFYINRKYYNKVIGLMNELGIRYKDI